MASHGEPPDDATDAPGAEPARVGKETAHEESKPPRIALVTESGDRAVRDAGHDDAGNCRRSGDAYRARRPARPWVVAQLLRPDDRGDQLRLRRRTVRGAHS